MSDLTKTIDIVFGGKNDLSPIVAGLEKDFKSFDAAVQGAAQPIADFGDKLLVAEAAVLSIAAAFVGKAIDSAGKFGDSITEIGTLFGGTTQQMSGFSNDVLMFGASSTQSIDSINGAIYEAVSSGVAWGDSIEFVKKNEELAVAGRANLVDVTNVMTGVLNAYGEKGRDTAESIKILSDYQDDLMTAVNIGKTTVPEMSAALSQVSTVAATAGVPFADLSAAIAAVTATGAPTAQAVTMIRDVMTTFIKPAQEASKYAAELGLNFDAQALKSKGLQGALNDVIAATGGSSEKMAKLFGNVEGLNGALILGKSNSAGFADALTQMVNNSGSTEAAFKKMSENYEFAMQKMANAADVAMIKAGKPLLDEFGGVANGIAAVFAGLGKGIDAGAFNPVIQALETFGQSAGATLQNIAANLPAALAQLDFSALIDSLGTLGGEVSDAFNKVFGEIDLDTPEGLASALQTIVDGIAAMTNIVAGIVDSFDPIFTAFGDLARAAGDTSAETQTAAGGFIGIAQQIVSFGGALTAALQLFSQTGTSVVDVVTVLVGGIKTIFNGVQIGIDLIAAAVLTTGEKIAQALALITFGDTSEAWRQKAAEYGGLLDDLNERVNANAGEMAEGWNQAAGGIDRITDATGKTIEKTGALANTTSTATEAAKTFVGIDWSQGATGIDYVGQAAKNLGIAMRDTGPDAEQFKAYVKTAGDEADIARAQTNGYRLEIDELGNRTFIPVIEGQKKTNQELRTAQKEMDAAAKKAVEYDLKLREIESKERIAYIEAKFQVDEAAIKADAERVTAAFASINTAISSTGETLTSLIGSWAGLLDKDRGSANELWTLIQAEEQRRKEAFAQQKLLLDAQIEYMKARTQTLQRGDTLIKVNADGLAPELERIFHEVLRRCQIKANEQGLELLLAGAN